MAAVAPARLDSHTTGIPYTIETGDLDAEGDEDPEAEYPMDEVQPFEPAEEAEASDAALSEGSEVVEEDEEEDDDDEDELTKPVVKVDKGKRRAQSDELSDEEVDEAEDSSAADDVVSGKESSEEESAVAEDWEAGSDVGEDAAVSIANRNNCIFCQQDEEHDPGEEYEEYMACSVCGDNSHRQCARAANSLASDDDAEHWRCPQCVDNALEADNLEEEEEEQEATSRRRRSSASRLTRDLLPAQRGTSKPGSHSIFNTLIVDGDPLDGSRSLRKRKATEEQEDAAPVPSKRSRPSSSKAVSERSASAAGSDRKDIEGLAAKNVEEASVSTKKSRSFRPSRSRRLKSVHSSPVTITTNDHNSIVVGIRLNPSRLAEILDAPPRRKKRIRPSRSKAAIEQRQEAARPQFARPQSARPQPAISSHYTTPFYAFHERENDDLKSKPYGGILSEADAETSKTLPLQADRVKFNEARQKAEEEWKLKTASAEAELEGKGRSSQKLSGPPSKIKCVSIGGFEIETWYAAPYPEEYSRNRVLYICEFCLKYMNSDYVAWRHKLKCPAKHPPGDEIYRERSVSVFEVDGRKNPVYCQNLCLLAKLFLGSKTLYYDVEPFLFYVMTEYDEFGCHFVGYFSKEKRPSSQNNVSCILTLPTHQRKGYGNLLISFSYLLTRVEGKTGSPEKPLSDMGLVSYRNYWRLILSYELLDQTRSLSITDLSHRTGMTADDIVAALEGLRALVRDPVSKTYALRLDREYLKYCIETWEAKAYVTLNPDSLVWIPYIMGRSNLAHYDHAPALPTIAPREGEDDDKPVVAEEGVQQIVQQAAISNGEVLTPNGIASAFDSQPNGEATATLTTQESTTLLTAPSPTPISSQISNDPPPDTIPAVRYEIFPPLPGSTMRQRNRGGQRSAAGRKFKPMSQATPTLRGGRSFGKGDGTASPKTGGRSSRSGTAALQGIERKTRSSLRLGGDGAIDSEHSEEEKESDAEEEQRGRTERKEEEVVVEEREEEEEEAIDEAMAGMEAERQLVGEAGKGTAYGEVDEEKDADFEVEDAEDAEDEDDEEAVEEEEEDD